MYKYCILGLLALFVLRSPQSGFAHMTAEEFEARI